MKKTVLILLILVLPLQAFAAMERNLVHILGGSGPGLEFVLKHITKHAGLVMHHHDDDGAIADDGTTHVDSSSKSVQHLADYEHGGSLNILLPTINQPGLLAVERIAPFLWPDIFSDRTTSPLLRPPRSLV